MEMNGVRPAGILVSIAAGQRPHIPLASHVLAGAGTHGEESGGRRVRAARPGWHWTCARRAGSDGDVVVLVFQANICDPSSWLMIISLQQVT
jgi:hypothetical protein